MRQYELTYLISDNVPESEITKVSGKIGGLISDEGGKVLKEESWGRRKLSYPIKKQLFATYVTLSFELEPEKLLNFGRDLKHENDLIRHLLIVKDSGKEKLILTAKDIANIEKITEAVGGEKSFEGVVGKTEESKDLMAVRGEETAPTPQQDIEDRSPDRSVGKEAEKVADTVDKKTKTAKAEIKDVKPIEAAKETVKKPVAEKAEKVVPAKDEAIAKKEPKKKTIKKDDTASDEADRLAKLNEELDEILGEDL